jgi:hypothetical protein
MPGINLTESFDGSSSPSGTVLNLNSTASYDFTKLLGTDVTVPVYFIQPPTKPAGFAGATTGLGNISVDGRMSLDLLLVNYSPTGTIAFPTGSTTKGFSTGSITYDLDNHFDRDWGLLTPFFDVDVGNTLSNGSTATARAIQRPYLTLGNVANFMVGSQLHLTGLITLSADVYRIEPWGPQTVFSRILRPGATGKGGTHSRAYEIVQKQVGGANLVDDDGYDASVEFSPNKIVDLTVAFDRSIRYDLNTVSFSVAFNITQMLSRRRY